MLKQKDNFNLPSPDSLRILSLSDLSLAERGKIPLCPASAIHTIRQLYPFLVYVSCDRSKVGDKAKLLVEIMTGYEKNKPEGYERQWEKTDKQWTEMQKETERIRATPEPKIEP